MQANMSSTLRNSMHSGLIHDLLGDLLALSDGIARQFGFRSRRGFRDGRRWAKVSRARQFVDRHCSGATVCRR